MAIDLHLHSTASDGGFTPEHVVEHAHSIGLKCIALTDHDTVAGIKPAWSRARELNIPFIPGIEMTTLDRGNEVHILGYFFDIECKKLQETIAEIYERIERRIRLIIKKLNELGFDISFEEVREVAQTGTMGRPHIARVMAKKGQIRSHQEAFDKYIGTQKPAFVEIEDAMTPEEAYHLISGCGGVPAVAHPGYLGRAHMMEDNDIFNHRVWGARAIEVFHTKHDNFMIDYYLNLAKKYDLAVVGGSDCHGDFYSSILMDRKAVPDWVAEKFVAFCSKLLGDLPIELNL